MLIHLAHLTATETALGAALLVVGVCAGILLAARRADRG